MRCVYGVVGEWWVKRQGGPALEGRSKGAVGPGDRLAWERVLLYNPGLAVDCEQMETGGEESGDGSEYGSASFG